LDYWLVNSPARRFFGDLGCVCRTASAHAGPSTPGWATSSRGPCQSCSQAPRTPVADRGVCPRIPAAGRQGSGHRFERSAAAKASPWVRVLLAVAPSPRRAVCCRPGYPRSRARPSAGVGALRVGRVWRRGQGWWWLIHRVCMPAAVRSRCRGRGRPRRPSSWPDRWRRRVAGRRPGRCAGRVFGCRSVRRHGRCRAGPGGRCGAVCPAGCRSSVGDDGELPVLAAQLGELVEDSAVGFEQRHGQLVQIEEGDRRRLATGVGEAVQCAAGEDDAVEVHQRLSG